MNREQALGRIREDLHDRPELLKACSSTIDFLSQQPQEALKRISFGLLGKAAGVQGSLEAVPVAEYLSSARIHLLEKQYVLIIEEEEFELSLDELAEAKRENLLCHPEDGEPIDDFSRYVYLFFTLSQDGRELMRPVK